MDGEFGRGSDANDANGTALQISTAVHNFIMFISVRRFFLQLAWLS